MPPTRNGNLCQYKPEDSVKFGKTLSEYAL